MIPSVGNPFHLPKIIPDVASCNQKTEPSPDEISLESPAFQKLSDFLDRQFLIQKEGAFFPKQVSLREILEYIKNSYEEISIVGGAVPWILGESPEEPNDFDIRLIVKDASEEELWDKFSELFGFFVALYGGECFTEEYADKIGDLFFNKPVLTDMPEKGLLYITFFFEKYELMIIGKMERGHLFTKDARDIPLKPLLCHEGLPSIHYDCEKEIVLSDIENEVVNADNPEKVDEMGWPLLISYLSRGYRSSSLKVEKTLLSTCIQNSKPVVNLFFKVISKHCKMPCCLYFNACESLRASGFDQIEDLRKILIGKNEGFPFIEALAKACRDEKIDFSYLSSYLRYLALMVLGDDQSRKTGDLIIEKIVHRGAEAVRIRCGENCFLLNGTLQEAIDGIVKGGADLSHFMKYFSPSERSWRKILIKAASQIERDHPQINALVLKWFTSAKESKTGSKTLLNKNFLKTLNSLLGSKRIKKNSSYRFLVWEVFGHLASCPDHSEIFPWLDRVRLAGGIPAAKALQWADSLKDKKFRKHLLSLFSTFEGVEERGRVLALLKQTDLSLRERMEYYDKFEVVEFDLWSVFFKRISNNADPLLVKEACLLFMRRVWPQATKKQKKNAIEILLSFDLKKEAFALCLPPEIALEAAPLIPEEKKPLFMKRVFSAFSLYGKHKASTQMLGDLVSVHVYENWERYRTEEGLVETSIAFMACYAPASIQIGLQTAERLIEQALSPSVKKDPKEMASIRKKLMKLSLILRWHMIQTRRLTGLAKYFSNPDLMSVFDEKQMATLGEEVLFAFLANIPEIACDFELVCHVIKFFVSAIGWLPEEKVTESIGCFFQLIHLIPDNIDQFDQELSKLGLMENAMRSLFKNFLNRELIRHKLNLKVGKLEYQDESHILLYPDMLIQIGLPLKNYLNFIELVLKEAMKSVRKEVNSFEFVKKLGFQSFDTFFNFDIRRKGLFELFCQYVYLDASYVCGKAYFESHITNCCQLMMHAKLMEVEMDELKEAVYLSPVEALKSYYKEDDQKRYKEAFDLAAKRLVGVKELPAYVHLLKLIAVHINTQFVTDGLIRLALMRFESIVSSDYDYVFILDHLIGLVLKLKETQRFEQMQLFKQKFFGPLLKKGTEERIIKLYDALKKGYLQYAEEKSEVIYFMENYADIFVFFKESLGESASLHFKGFYDDLCKIAPKAASQLAPYAEARGLIKKS